MFKRIKNLYYKIRHRNSKEKYREYRENNENWENWKNDSYENDRNWEENIWKIDTEINLEKSLSEMIDIDEIMKRTNFVFGIEEINKVQTGEIVEVPLRIIRYSQRKINPVFRAGNSVYTLIENMRKEYVKYVDDVPMIKICIEDNKIYSFDNRRLYVLKNVLEENSNILCEIGNSNERNFIQKRKQAKRESDDRNEVNFDYKTVILDRWARGKWY